MARRFARFRLALAGFAALALVGVTGCGGGGGGYSEPYVGTLEIENSVFSSFGVDSVDIDEVGGPDHFSYNVFLAPGEFTDFDLFPDSYDITVFWSNGDVEFFFVDVFDHTTTYLEVVN